MLKENQDKIDWNYLSTNPNAIEILKNNKHKLNWDYISSNINIFKINKNNKEKEVILTADIIYIHMNKC